jgi:tetratricopeptide (TPR) repeat protein
MTVLGHCSAIDDPGLRPYHRTKGVGMSIRTTILVFSAALATGPLAAQNLRLATAQPARYTPPLCPLKATNSKIEKGIDQLKKAYDAKTPADRGALLTQAKTNLTDAMAKEAQGSNPAAWYYLGRVALMQGDPAGADSAFTKAQELVPSCEIDITQYRQNNWALLGQAGIEMQRKGETDSALALFRDASLLFRGLPHVYSNMGVVFANTGHDDSAGVYFQKALAIAEKDTSLVEDRNAAAINLAIMYKRQNHQSEAIAILKRYLTWKPNDTDARKELASSFRAAGMADSADKIELAMVAEFSKANLDSLDMTDLLAVGVAAFNAARYPEAVTAFGKAVKRNPWSRDARYNLANTYLAQKDNEHLIEQSAKLLELEPMNEDALRLLAQGQRGLKQDEQVLKTAERLVALPFTVDVSGFQMGPTGVRFIAEATGRSPQDPAGKPLKTAPITLVFEFVDQAGSVVDSKEITIPVLAKDAKHPIQIDGKGAGITGWRYHNK